MIKRYENLDLWTDSSKSITTSMLRPTRLPRQWLGPLVIRINTTANGVLVSEVSSPFYLLYFASFLEGDRGRQVAANWEICPAVREFNPAISKSEIHYLIRLPTSAVSQTTTQQVIFLYLLTK